MPLGSDTLLLLVFYGFYLADCVVLLHPAQALAQLRMLPAKKRRTSGVAGRGSLGIGRRCQLSLDFGVTYYPVRGRFLALLNPLTPFIPMFKTRPVVGVSGKPVAAIDLRRMAAIRLRTARMSFAVVSHGLLMFGLLPLLLLAGETSRLLIAVAAAFVSAGLILAMTYPDRRALRLSRSGFWLLAGQALLCLPTSLNFPRKLALLSITGASAPELLTFVPPERRAAAIAELRIALDYAATGASDEKAQVIAATIRHLAAEFPDV